MLEGRQVSHGGLTMQLMVFRHGIAEDYGPDGTDASRRLTDEGVSRTKEAARGLAKLMKAPDVILASPKVRAAETARLVAEAFDDEVETMDELAEGPAAVVVRALAKRSEESILLVGHEPTLSELVMLLCAGPSSSGGLEMKKAGCASMHVTRGGRGSLSHGVLMWLATPAMLRAIR